MSKTFRKLIALICVVLLTAVFTGGAVLADDEADDQRPEVIVVQKGITAKEAEEEPADNHVYAVALAASVAAVNVASEDPASENPEEEEENAAVEVVLPLDLPEEAAEEIRLLGYTEIPVYINGTDSGSAIKIDDCTYVPMDSFFKAIGFELESSWDQESGIASFRGDGIEISAEVGGIYLAANGRYFYVNDIKNIGGVIFAPIEECAKCFGAEVVCDEETGTVNIGTENAAPLMSADAFYPEEDLYWLSRIIFAESGNQPFEGKLGVGNVVINRVNDPTCPDTIYDVIFDNQYGVQFSVTENGTIYLEPSEESVMAAKMCLEGYNTVGDSLFFVNPAIGSTNWFACTRTFIARIGEHDFYA